MVGSRQENPTLLTRQDWLGENWDETGVGRWLLAVDEGGPYDVTLLFDPSNRLETASLTIGDRTLTQRVSPEVDACTFRNVRMAAGNTEIGGVLIGDGRRRGPYQIVLTRR